MAAKPDKNDHHITLYLKSTAGAWPDARFNIENRAKKVLDEAIDHFNLRPDPQRPYVLRRERDNVVLGLDQKLEDLQMHNGDVVLVQPTQATDG